MNPAISLTGQTLAGCLVLRHIGPRQVRCRCACGEEFTTARNYVARKDRDGEIATCRACLNRLRSVNARGNRAWMEKRGRPGDTAQRKGRHCLSCEDLPWRRPVNGHCPRCHRAHAEEPPVSVADVMAAHVGAGRVFPSSGAW